MSSAFCLNRIALLVLCVAVSGCAVRNPDVMRQIETEPDGYRAQNTLILESPDGRRFPVNYLREGNVVYLGADGRWWRQFETAARVTLILRGATVGGTARAVRDDPQLRRRVFRELRPLFPTWLPEWLGGVLVAVELDEPVADVGFADPQLTDRNPQGPEARPQKVSLFDTSGVTPRFFRQERT